MKPGDHRQRGIAALAAAVVALAIVLVFVLPSQAQQTDDEPPVLHQDLTPPADEAARTAARAKDLTPMFGPEPSAGQNPSAIGSNQKLLPEPDVGKDKADSEPVHGSGDRGSNRDRNVEPDYGTSADGTLHYVEVFNPSIVPFKRMSAMDRVNADYSMTFDGNSLTDVSVGGKPTRTREKFWGSLVINLETGKDIPIPSVSPDMRILSYEIKPKIPITFAKDSADNYYVRTEESGISGEHRLVFLVDGAAVHFAPQISPRYRVADIPRSMIPPMPANVKKSAQRALSILGVRRNMRLKDALDRMVQYFRRFEAKAAPPNTGDIFWDLFQSRAGVCRHRSFAFMVVANAFGIPTRYVANEAHAWVEVWVPESEWLRIDLGGAALRLEVTNAEDKTMHRPRGEDPFPQPDVYKDSYTQLVGDVRGLTPDQIAERRADSDGSGAVGSDFFGTGDEAAGPADGTDSEGRLIGPGEGLPEIPSEELARKIPTAIEVTSATAVGFRGESVEVGGRLVDGDGNGLGGQRVNIFIATPNTGAEDALLVGGGATAADGNYQISVALPTTIDLGDYEIYAASPGNEDYAPSVSQ